MPSTTATAVAVAAAFLLGTLAVSSGTIYALPLFRDATGPTDLRVTGFDRLDAGCRDVVGTYASSSNGPNGTYASTTFIETGSENANLSVSTERTTSVGADFSIFRIDVDSHRRGPANDTCDVGVQYRLRYQVTGGSDGGLLGGDRGVRIVTLENGRYSDCAVEGTGRFENVNCARFLEARPTRTWANATV